MKRQKLELNIDVTFGRIYSGYVEAPFFEAKEILEEWGFGIISLKENLRLRMQEGKKSSISKYGNWTREAVVYIPDKGRFLVKKSPFLEDKFYNMDEQFEKALTDSVQITDKGIPTRKFGEEELTVFAFGDNAEECGRFLDDAGITLMSPWLKSQDYTNKRVTAFVKQVWFGGLRPYRISLIANDDAIIYFLNKRLRGLYNFPLQYNLRR